ncbi:MAG TPA: LysM domain-containing protein [Trebonia sp.]|nr:LysM domain-containing protein [Trebonia sp.]
MTEAVPGPAWVARYVVQPGDTLSRIAAALAVPGGWQALYTANRPLIGPNPDVIRAGVALTVPEPGGQPASARYKVQPGDTLSRIAAALAVPGGWQALYTANRPLIGPNPDIIRTGLILTAPRPAAVRPPSTVPPTGPGHQPGPPPATRPSAPGKPTASPTKPSVPSGSSPAVPAAPPATPPVSASPSPRPASPSASPGAGKRSMTSGGFPPWLAVMLIVAAVLIGIAFLAEPALVLVVWYRRGNRHRIRAAPAGTAGGDPGTRAGPAASGPAANEPAANEPAASGSTASRSTGNGYSANGSAAKGSTANGKAANGSMGSSGALQAAAITAETQRAAERARIILADHDRLIVTYSLADHTVYVLTPPGEDPLAVLRAARLILPEETYQDLAGHLGVAPNWPLE